jgi:hypothetical protein
MCIFFDSIFKCSRKKFPHQLFHELGTDTDLDRPNPDWHALDADPDPEPAKCCGSNPNLILIQTLQLAQLIF